MFKPGDEELGASNNPKMNDKKETERKGVQFSLVVQIY